MTSTTYGYLNPNQGDLSKGTTGWMVAMNSNWLRIDQHSHNGIDSTLLTSASIVPLTLSGASVVAHANWVAVSGLLPNAGIPQSGYYQLLTVPSGVTEINNFNLTFLVANNVESKQNQPLNLAYARVTGTSFRLFINDNTIDVNCVFK